MMTESTELAIETNKLSRQFGRSWAVSEVSLQVPRGSVCALFGLNGSGKTTLIRLLLGHLRPTSGTIRVLGRNLAQEVQEIRKRVGYVSESRYLYDWMTVRETLDFTRAFHENWDGGKVDSLIERLRLPLEQRVGQLSRGHRARLCLTLALAYNPELIILDELTSGLDVMVRREVLRNVIEEISREGRTVLFSSHSVDEVERLADRVAILQAGQLLAQRPIDELKRSGQSLEDILVSLVSPQPAPMEALR
jgi:ABC-2 type transport system ATP-binding protein